MKGIGRRCGRWRGRNVVAAWLTVLLTLAPFAERGLAYGGAPSAQRAASPDDALAPSRDPVTSPRAHPSAGLGLLSRLLPGDGKPGLDPGKTPELSAAQADAALVHQTAAAANRHVVSVAGHGIDKTAHPSTGPPA